MEKCSAMKNIEKGYLPESAIFGNPGQYEKTRWIKEADLLAAYGGKLDGGPDGAKASEIALEDKNPQVVPSAVWTAGLLYSAYFSGEVMHLFDVADILVTRWAQGRLIAEDEQTITALDRLTKKRERRISSEERALLYKRIFNFGQMNSDSYIRVNESFPEDWNLLMKGVAAYPKNPKQGCDEAELAARAMIFKATQNLQVHLSEAMAGTAYLMAAEVCTLLRESSDLLRCQEIICRFGWPNLGMNSVIEHIVAEEFNQQAPVQLLTMTAETGSRILQEWVAKFQPQGYSDPLPQTLLALAQDWRISNSYLAGL